MRRGRPIYGIDILDGVYNDIGNAEGFVRECEEARDMGFDGKTLIHPNQIGPCNAAFSPGADEMAQARKMIAAFDLPENRDKGVVAIDGKMVERLHAEMARRTVEIAQAIEARAVAAQPVCSTCPSSEARPHRRSFSRKREIPVWVPAFAGTSGETFYVHKNLHNQS